MTITLALLPVEYRDGMVICPMGKAPISTRRFNASTAQDIIQHGLIMQSDYDGNFNAKIAIVEAQGRKVNGYDSTVRPAINSMYCNRAAAWDAMEFAR